MARWRSAEQTRSRRHQHAGKNRGGPRSAISVGEIDLPFELRSCHHAVVSPCVRDVLSFSIRRGGLGEHGKCGVGGTLFRMVTSSEVFSDSRSCGRGQDLSSAPGVCIIGRVTWVQFLHDAATVARPMSPTMATSPWCSWMGRLSVCRRWLRQQAKLASSHLASCSYPGLLTPSLARLGPDRRCAGVHASAASGHAYAVVSSCICPCNFISRLGGVYPHEPCAAIHTKCAHRA